MELNTIEVSNLPHFRESKPNQEEYSDSLNKTELPNENWNAWCKVASSEWRCYFEKLPFSFMGWYNSGICAHQGLDQGREKTVPVIIRTVIWTPPEGGTRIIQKPPVPTDATEDDLMYRVSVETERL
jgi:hypothetical protein